MNLKIKGPEEDHLLRRAMIQWTSGGILLPSVIIRRLPAG